MHPEPTGDEGSPKETTINMVNIYSPSSRSMSRRLALTLGLLLALLLSLPSHARDRRSKVPINRTISGFTLGVTTPAQARAIIQRQGGKIILEVGVHAGSKDASYIVSGLNYARRPTQTVAMFFYKGHLHSIDFIFDGWDVLEQIESELEDKYGMMIESEGMFKKKSIADARSSPPVRGWSPSPIRSDGGVERGRARYVGYRSVSIC